MLTRYYGLISFVFIRSFHEAEVCFTWSDFCTGAFCLLQNMFCRFCTNTTYIKWYSSIYDLLTFTAIFLYQISCICVATAHECRVNVKSGEEEEKAAKTIIIENSLAQQKRIAWVSDIYFIFACSAKCKHYVKKYFDLAKMENRILPAEKNT